MKEKNRVIEKIIGGCDSDMEIMENFSEKKLHLSSDLTSLGRMTQGTELRKVGRARVELETSRYYYGSLSKRLE